MNGNIMGISLANRISTVMASTNWMVNYKQMLGQPTGWVGTNPE